MFIKENVSLPTYYFGHVISVLKDSGIGVDTWLASQNLDLNKLLQANSRVSIEQFDGLMQTVITSRGFEDLGLSVGKRLEIAHHGDFGLAILNSASLLQVLDFHVKFLSIRIPLIQIMYVIENEQVVVTLIDEHWQDKLHVSMIEAVIIAVVNMLHATKFEDGSDLEIELVEFDYSKPNYWEKYSTIKANKLEFNARHCNLRFARTNLRKPLACSDDFSFQRAVVNCENELDSFHQQNLSMRDRVKRLLKQDGGVRLGLDDLAEQLFMSKRSLHRGLEREGTSFKLLMQEVRADLALKFLNQDYSISRVADLLNYSDSANFRRAFKTWYKMAPREWLMKERLSKSTKTNTE
ncbi:MAG: AraC-like DNA-binding protein [Glaciecola sp.]|jgi:AraC-like DNA-binding protein